MCGTVTSSLHGAPKIGWRRQKATCMFQWLTLQTTLKLPNFEKEFGLGTPSGQNVILVKKDKLQVRVQGNTLFAGWTMPIPLYPPKHSLPPCCLLFEGHGELKPGVSTTSVPSGRTQVHEFNRFEAFVTFLHPSSKYSGPGTDGFFDREHIMTAYPPPPK